MMVVVTHLEMCWQLSLLLLFVNFGGVLFVCFGLPFFFFLSKSIDSAQD